MTQSVSGRAEPLQPKLGRRPNIRARLVFYPLLFVVGAMGVFPVTLVLGYFVFIIPGLVMIAASWLMLYLPLIDWPLTAWRATNDRAAVVTWLCLALALPVGVPLVSHLPPVAAALEGTLVEDAPLAVPLQIEFETQQGIPFQRFKASGASFPKIERSLNRARWRLADVLDGPEVDGPKPPVVSFEQREIERAEWEKKRAEEIKATQERWAREEKELAELCAAGKRPLRSHLPLCPPGSPPQIYGGPGKL